MQAEDALRPLHAGRLLAAGEFGDVDQPERGHVGKVERPFAQARTVGGTGRAELRNMAERIGAEITIGVRIACAADTEGVENEEKGTRHLSPAS